jgi:hypothetical protein
MIRHGGRQVGNWETLRDKERFTYMRHRKQFFFLLVLWIFITLLASAEGRKTSAPPDKTTGKALLETADNQTTTAHILRLNRPSDDKIPSPPAPGLEVRTLYGLKVFFMEDLRAIHFASLQKISIISDPATLLINPDNISPLSEGIHWYELKYDDSRWEKPVLAHPHYRWFYIPGASWIWRRKDSSSPEQDGLFLRRKFQIPADLAPYRAVLSITVDETLHQIFLNGSALPVKDAVLKESYLSLDVSLLIREGENILALKAGKSPREGLSFAGLAFRLDLYCIPKESVTLPLGTPPPADILLENGDHLFGEIISLSDRWLEVQWLQNKTTIDRDWIRRIGLNMGSAADTGDQKRNIFQKVLGKDSREQAPKGGRSYPPFSFLIHPRDEENKIGLLLNTGEFIKGRILELDEDGVVIKPRYGHDFTINLREIKYIYPNEPGTKTYLRYPMEPKPWRCEIILQDGSAISGLMEDLTPESLSVKPPYSQSLNLKTSHIVSTFFPFNPIQRFKKDLSETKDQFLSVALLGETDPQGPAYEQSHYFKIQCILSELDMEGMLLAPEDLVMENILTPKRFRILLNIDETETYYKSVNRENDGYNALVNYVRKGGSLAHIATGVPAFYGYERQNGYWKRTVSPPYLNETIKMNILTPGEVSKDGQTLELPDNHPSELFFELNPSTPYAKGLPIRVEFPFNRDTRFRPIVEDTASTSTLFTPLYYLKSERGTNYGAAMAVIDYLDDGFQKTRCFYVSHLLYTSLYNRHSMLNYLIPKILSLSLTSTPPSAER